MTKQQRAGATAEAQGRYSNSSPTLQCRHLSNIMPTLRQQDVRASVTARRHLSGSWSLRDSMLMQQRQHAVTSATACRLLSNSMPKLQRQYAKATATACRSYSNRMPNSFSFHIINKIACALKHPKFLVCSRYNFITVPIITKVTCNINSQILLIISIFKHGFSPGYNDMQLKAA